MYNPRLTRTLLIVETHAKCDTVSRCLGEGYVCCDLATARRGLPEADSVVLACNPDAEGELRCAEVLRACALPPSTPRIKVSELTEPALRHALRYPGTVDPAVAGAQAARATIDARLQDRLNVMYPTSVIPAMCLMHEREDLQRQQSLRGALLPHTVTAYVSSLRMPFRLTTAAAASKFAADNVPCPDNNTPCQTRTETEAFLEESLDFRHEFSCGPTGATRSLPPPPPLTTTAMLRLSRASSPQATMHICQTLYEDGYITFPYTDRAVYSRSFGAHLLRHIEHTYSSLQYADPSLHRYASSHQDSFLQQQQQQQQRQQQQQQQPNAAVDGLFLHEEAIRPTDMGRLCLTIDNRGLAAGGRYSLAIQKRRNEIYSAIWLATLQSGMAPATALSVTAALSAPHRASSYTFTAQQWVFPGWKLASNGEQMQRDETEASQRAYHMLPHMQLLRHDPEIEAVSAGAPRLTEVDLIAAMEQRGVGTPFTRLRAVDALTNYRYVERSHDPGVVDSTLYLNYASRLIDEANKCRESKTVHVFPQNSMRAACRQFTVDMARKLEASLAAVAAGQLDGCAVCEEWAPVQQSIDDAEMADAESADLPSSAVAEAVAEAVTEAVAEAVPRKRHLGSHAGAPVTVHKGPYGLYIEWGKVRRSLKGCNRPLENITLDDARRIMAWDDSLAAADTAATTEAATNTAAVPAGDFGTSKTIVREISKACSVRWSVRGRYLYWKTARMLRPLFYDLGPCPLDYETCPLDELVQWIRGHYGIHV